MKNKIALLIIAFGFALNFTAQAQKVQVPGPDLQDKAAGYELVKATRHYYLGTVMLGGGLVIYTIGAVQVLNSPNTGAGGGLVLLGSCSVLTGLVFIIESYSHIGRAGKILMQRNDLSFGPTQSGVGVSLRF